MFSLFENCITCISRKKKSKRNITLIVVGLDNAGKTTTIKSLKHQPNEEVAPTIGFASETINKDNADVTLYDLGGGPKIRGIWYNYLSESHGVIFVVDSTDRDRLNECKAVFADLIKHPKIKGKPILLLANKQDKAAALDEGEICDALNLEQLVNEHECRCRVELTTACSTKYKHKKWVKPTKSNRILEGGFSWLIQEILSKYVSLNERVVRDVQEQRKKEAETRRLKIEKVRRIREQRALEEERAQNVNDSHILTETYDAVAQNISINETENASRNNSVTDMMKSSNKMNSSTKYTVTDTTLNNGLSNKAFDNGDCSSPEMLPGSVVDLKEDTNNIDKIIPLSSLTEPSNSSTILRNSELSSNSTDTEKPKKKSKKKKGNRVQPFDDNGDIGQILPSMRLSPIKTNNGDIAQNSSHKNALPPISTSSSASSPRPNMEDDEDIIT